ncbi:hypothetical protein ADUPG1_000157, partial [Aduncisulcus paluster]
MSSSPKYTPKQLLGLYKEYPLPEDMKKVFHDDLMSEKPVKPMSFTAINMSEAIVTQPIKGKKDRRGDERFSVLYSDPKRMRSSQKYIPQHQQRAKREANIQWEYIDTSGKIQGPYNNARMAGWFKRSLFKQSLLVKQVQEKDFFPLSLRFPGVVPFALPIPPPPETPSLPPGMEMADALHEPIEHLHSSSQQLSSSSSAHQLPQFPISGHQVGASFPSSGSILPPFSTSDSAHSSLPSSSNSSPPKMSSESAGFGTLSLPPLPEGWPSPTPMQTTTTQEQPQTLDHPSSHQASEPLAAPSLPPTTQSQPQQSAQPPHPSMHGSVPQGSGMAGQSGYPSLPHLPHSAPFPFPMLPSLDGHPPNPQQQHAFFQQYMHHMMQYGLQPMTPEQMAQVQAPMMPMPSMPSSEQPPLPSSEQHHAQPPEETAQTTQ